MALITMLVAIMIGMSLFTMILYVIFSQVTVRKLRNNPQTKHALGTEFVSGWDVINVAQALAFPRSWSNKLENTRLSFIHAKASFLLENTGVLDRVLGIIFYWFMTVTGIFGIVIVILNFFCVFAK